MAPPTPARPRRYVRPEAPPSSPASVTRWTRPLAHCHLPGPTRRWSGRRPPRESPAATRRCSRRCTHVPFPADLVPSPVAPGVFAVRLHEVVRLDVEGVVSHNPPLGRPYLHQEPVAPPPVVPNPLPLPVVVPTRSNTPHIVADGCIHRPVGADIFPSVGFEVLCSRQVHSACRIHRTGVGFDDDLTADNAIAAAVGP